MAALKKIIPGAFLALALALPAFILGKHFELIGGPIFGILFGACFGYILRAQHKSRFAYFSEGVSFCSKYVLQAAVVLLGFGLNFAQIVEVGQSSLLVILSTIATALVISYVIAKSFGMPKDIATLVGVGSSICGGSAIAATAPVIGAKDSDVAQAISVIFFYNVIAALIFPALGQALHLSNTGFAYFAGTAVNDTSSVTATAAAWDGMHAGANTLAVATIVKLTRTLAIIPITLALSIYTSKQSGDAGKGFSLARALPTFIILFLVAALISTFVPLPKELLDLAKQGSKLGIVIAMVAIGINTDITKLIKTGAKPLLLGGICWVAIAMVSLVVQHLIGIV